VSTQRLVHHVREELDCPALGQGSVAARSRQSRSSAGYRRPTSRTGPKPKSSASGWEFCSHNPIVGHTGWKQRKMGPEHRCSGQCQASEAFVEIDGGRSSAGLDRARVPRSAFGVSGCRPGNTSRRTGRSVLDGLRSHQPGLRYPTFLLLASRRASDRYQVGGFGAAVADASGAQRWPAGMENSKSAQPAWGLRLRFGEAKGLQAPGPGVGEDPAGVREDRYPWCGLAYFPAYSSHASAFSIDARESVRHPATCPPSRGNPKSASRD
jgi:hypothetical protein